jgi:flagellum-specific peptidoglycan hydrolase FlgJ
MSAFHNANDLQDFFEMQILRKRKSERYMKIGMICISISAVGFVFGSIATCRGVPSRSPNTTQQTPNTTVQVAPQNQTVVSKILSTFHKKTWIESVANLTSEKDRKAVAYIFRYAKIAKAEETKYGIPKEIILAQGILESGIGESSLAKKANNHFGIKCFSHTCKKGHCMNFADDSHKDFFKKYPSAWKSFRDHSLFLKREHYKTLFQKETLEDWAKELSRLGYATDKEYAQLLMAIIKKYHLEAL